MKFLTPILSLTLLLCACSEDPPAPVAAAYVPGALIDGSEDGASTVNVKSRVDPQSESEAGTDSVASSTSEQLALASAGSTKSEGVEAGGIAPEEGAAQQASELESSAGAEEAQVDSKASQVPETQTEAAATDDNLDPGGTQVAPDAIADEDAAKVESEEASAKRDELEPLPEGIVDVTYQDLSLIDYDVDAMLDYMLFPEEYEDEETADLEFPPEVKRLDGREVSIVGYMIPGEIDQGNVRDFMLVRDLMGCCFGGSPMPDEWVDVLMEEDAEAEYRPYMPMRVTGVLTLGGDQDEAGFALGIYRMKAVKAQLED